MATGIRKRGSSYEASIYLKREGRKLRRTFPTAAGARAWRAEALTAANKGALRSPKPTTLRRAWEEWEQRAKAGMIRDRSGNRYKPSTLRAYERTMRLRVLPEFGAARFTDVQRLDLQDLVERLLASGLSPSTVQVTLLPVRAIYKRAIQRGELAVNPTSGLEMPAVSGGRDRVADPIEAAALIAAVADQDKAVWATALYAGLRRGELMAVRWEDIDLAAGIIRVERGWDDREGVIELKSKAGRRRVPIIPELRDQLIEHRLLTGRHTGLVFGRDAETPFTRAVSDRADIAWKEAELERVTLHECRHTFAAFMIAAGVNAKALSTFMGHANISVTLDRYGHLMPGSEAEAAGLLDAYLIAARDRAEAAARASESGAIGAFTGASAA
jgi:integrase